MPPGDTHEWDIRAVRGLAHRDNPKLVTGKIVHRGGLLAPCRGFSTLPARFMELDEAAKTAAIPEAREEANAEIVIDRLLAVYATPRHSRAPVNGLAHLAVSARLQGRR